MIEVVHIAVCMKPIDGNFASNALEHGVAGLNVDGCRVAHSEPIKPMKSQAHGDLVYGQSGRHEETTELKASGRWPANLIHDGSDEVVEEFPVTKSGVAVRRNGNAGRGMFPVKIADGSDDVGYGDSGSAARFFQTCETDERKR